MFLAPVQALTSVQPSIQFRILRLIQESDRHAETGALSAAIEGKIQAYSVDIDPVMPGADSSDHAACLGPGGVRALLSTYRERQDKGDLTRDTADLRRAIQAVLQADSDNAMIEILQVNQDDIPEAIKTLQRALEREPWMEQDVEGAMSGEIASGKPASLCSPAGPNKSSTSRDTLFREFLESGSKF